MFRKHIVVAVLVFAPTLAFAEPNQQMRTACMGDVKAFCGSVQQGGGRIKECIKEHHAQLSPGCKAAFGNH